ncbi:hypothetical protein B0F90DRAFT_1932074 [Multifurca ochricompacta]|uniref:Uncharacterized protein n=1 Tax=Multifurca ochricompacta TaxID=376703 RepID=A0AAD4MDS2_9AGAM|nr:hypothetical protein B0F90DRAFT_1932074 [Multifurca ochricompacta]
MSPSVRVRRRHAYTSIHDEDRANSEQLRNQPDRGRQPLSGGSGALSSTAASQSTPLSRDPVHPPATSHDLGHNYPSFRRDISRVNRHVRRSNVSYRSFTTDPDSNVSGSPPPTVSRLSNLPPQHETIYEGTSAEVVIPGPHRGHVHRASRVQSALSSSPSRGSPDSDSDSDTDSEDEDRIMEDDEYHHDDDVVDHLDVIDPQVSTVATLTNAANSILLPPISFYSRKPVVVLPRTEREQDIEAASVHTASTDELDRHVHDVLKRKQKFRRVMKGVWAFLRTPLGIAFGIYGFLVVFWGTAIVFFLAKWINLHNQTTQDFWEEVTQQIENGLFCLTGIGLIPWRIIDTYRMSKIWYYKRRTRRLRKKAGLPELYDKDDLPDPIFDPNYVHVLTDRQQYELHHRNFLSSTFSCSMVLLTFRRSSEQKKFMKSQTWYRPHGTETHRAFPINTALWICLLNDGNSVFQCILAACMWSMNRFDRPSWTTGLLIPLAFGCGILSGILIWQGGKKTKRTERVEERLRRALEIDHSEHALAPDGVMAKLQDTIANHNKENKEGESAESGSPLGEKHGHQYHSTADGVGNQPDYASTRNSSIRSPGIKIEEEMVVPPVANSTVYNSIHLLK